MNEVTTLLPLHKANVSPCQNPVVQGVPDSKKIKEVTQKLDEDASRARKHANYWKKASIVSGSLVVPAFFLPGIYAPVMASLMVGGVGGSVMWRHRRAEANSLQALMKVLSEPQGKSEQQSITSFSTQKLNPNWQKDLVAFCQTIKQREVEFEENLSLGCKMIFPAIMCYIMANMVANNTAAFENAIPGAMTRDYIISPIITLTYVSSFLSAMVVFTQISIAMLDEPTRRANWDVITRQDVTALMNAKPMTKTDAVFTKVTIL